MRKVSVYAGYGLTRSNAGVGECGCFHLSGGVADGAYRVTSHLAGVVEVSGASVSEVGGSGHGLSLLTYGAGPRVFFVWRRFQPFAQAIAGGALGFHSFFPTDGAASSAGSFFLGAGGGVTVGITPHLGIRPVQVDYQLTLLPNATTNRQNNLRLSVGLVVRLR